MERVGTLIGPYRIRRLLASGGMGQVFAAIHERLEQEVALKLLSPEAVGDPQLVARFLQEGRALARFQHPGVVRVLNCDQLDDGTVFLAMELLQGQSLREWMRCRPGPAPLDVSLELGRRIAGIVADIHAQNIVHRDLKPENVFLCHDGSDTSGHRIKLLDFGIAKVPPSLSENRVDTQVQTLAPIILGTATYMAPEQLRNAALVDDRADVYALGVLLFELLAGKPPFDSSELVEVISMHLRSEPPPLQELVSAIPGVLSTFIASMLAKDPAQRPDMLQCQEMFGRAWEDCREECPLPGLAAFTDTQAGLFFGRKAEVDELLGSLEMSREGRQRWVQLEGPSGVGKSSLVQAGLLPHLKKHPPQSAPAWRIANLRPSHAPTRNLALALHAAYAGTGLDRTPEQLEEELLAGPEALRLLVTASTPPGGRLLLVIEQMEELFTLGEADQQRMDEWVSAALAAPDSPLRLLTTLRSDFLHRMEQLPRLARQLNEAVRHLLQPMEEDALTQVIKGMAQRAGLRLSEGLPERMVRDTTSEGSRLSLLGHALRGLWVLRSGTTLTHERYEQLGGVGGALARQAEALLDGLGASGRERAKWLLLDLVQVSRGAPAIRRSRSWQEVLAAAGGDALAEEVLLRLSGMGSGPVGSTEQALRLIVVSGGPEPARQRVELIHETLLQKVPSLAGWLELERARLERQTDLEFAAHTWEQAGCPEDDLPTGSLLEHYRRSADVLSPRGLQTRKVGERALRFLEAARRLERRRARLRLALGVASLAAAVAILVSAVQAIQEKHRAEANLQTLIGITNEFVSDVDWKLGRRAHTLDARQQLFERFDELLANLPEQDRESLQGLMINIKTRQRRSDLSFHDGTLAQADLLLGLARESLQRGLIRHPGDPDLTFQLGLNDSKRGKVAQARGRLEEARTSFTEANEHFEHPPPKHKPEDHRRTRATSYSELAELELASGQAGRAAALYDSAISLLEQNRDDTYDRSLLAETLGFRAEAARVAGEREAAERYFQRALDMARALSQSDPGDTYYRWVLARLLVKLADFRLASGAHAAGAEYFQEVLSLGRTLHDGEKPNKRYALVLVESLLGSEKLARAQGDSTRAERLYAERCALVGDFTRADPEDVRFRGWGCP